MPLSAAALEPLLRLAVVPGIGPARLALLIRRFGSAERVLAASAEEVGAIPGFGPELARRVKTASTEEGRVRAREGARALRDCGAVAITPDDLAYPDAFRALPDPPYLLFARGDLDLLTRPGIGVVGTRAPTDYGRRATMELAGALARAGYSIVSGMAKGIDAAAHAAALDAGAATVGVLGQGIDRIYPPENRELFRRVADKGLLISELAPGEEPLAGNFPRRNRLIAALSQGVLVVEMGQKSGAQHTVTYALEMGREVFAVPGPIGSPASAGTNQLLKDGARLVTSARDVLEELRGVGIDGDAPVAIAVRASAGSPSIEISPPARREPPPDLPAAQATVLAALADDPRHVDELALAVGGSTGSVLAALLELELQELAEALPGKQFRRR